MTPPGHFSSLLGRLHLLYLIKKTSGGEKNGSPLTLTAEKNTVSHFNGYHMTESYFNSKGLGNNELCMC